MPDESRNVDRSHPSRGRIASKCIGKETENAGGYRLRWLGNKRSDSRLSVSMTDRGGVHTITDTSTSSSFRFLLVPLAIFCANTFTLLT